MLGTGEVMMLTEFVTSGKFPCTVVEKSFSDFSVGCCIQIMVICYQLKLRKELSDVSTECFRGNIGKFFSEPKLVTDNLSLSLKHFMQGQRLTVAHEPAKGHDANQQSIQYLMFMQIVLSCVTSL